MADQLAVAIENARLLREMQQTIRELEVTTGQYTQESWEAVIRGLDQPLGYRYRHLDVEPVTEQPPEVRQAWEQGHLVITTSQPGSEGDEQEVTSTLAVPVTFRGQVVGVLNLRFEGETVATETVSMIEEVANRLGLALESARLHQETQRRAARDRLVSEVAGHMRETLDVDTVLQTAVREMRQALDIAEVEVRLSTGEMPREEA
jgi:GAF domain-containing protein